MLSTILGIWKHFYDLDTTSNVIVITVYSWLAKRMSDFHSYAKTHLQFFQQHGQKVTYKKGQLLVRRDEPSPWMFFLESGLVKMAFASQDGTERIYGFGVPGMSFTQSGSFYTLPHMDLEFEAHIDSIVWRLPREQFIKELETNIPMLREWHERILQNHNMLTERILYTGEKDPRNRIIAWLLGMARYYSFKQKDGRIILEIPMTQDIMASFVHLSRERTNIILSELRKRNLITIKKQYITFPDIDLLRKELYSQ